MERGGLVKHVAMHQPDRDPDHVRIKTGQVHLQLSGEVLGEQAFEDFDSMPGAQGSPGHISRAGRRGRQGIGRNQQYFHPSPRVWSTFIVVKSAPFHNYKSDFIS